MGELLCGLECRCHLGDILWGMLEELCSSDVTKGGLGICPLEELCWSPVQVLLGDNGHRHSVDNNKSPKGNSLERMSSSQAADKKLTLMDLIEDHGAKSGAPAPGVHLTRHSASREQLLRKVAASGSAPLLARCMGTDTAPCTYKYT